jgi:hypothetical protein
MMVLVVMKCVFSIRLMALMFFKCWVSVVMSVAISVFWKKNSDLKEEKKKRKEQICF